MTRKLWSDRMKDGLYVQFFVVKDGVSYPCKVVSMQDMTRTLVNAMMDGVEKIATSNDTNGD